MAHELTSHVLQVLAYGMSLKERILSGESVLLDAENAKLKSMLWADGSVRGHPDYGDNVPRPVQPTATDFLGVRYALASWLDEIFINDIASANGSWSRAWKEKSLESELFGGGQERAWRFWLQADLAEKRPGAEAVEAYLWCVMLGFRGDPGLLNPPEWVERVRRRVITSHQQEFRMPADLGMKTNVPALRGRDRFRTAGRVLMIVVAAGLFAGAAVLAQYLSKND
jgi:type VI secretion system protein ImpK